MLVDPRRGAPDLEGLRAQLHADVDALMDGIKVADAALEEADKHLRALCGGARWELGVVWQERSWGLQASPTAYRTKQASGKRMPVQIGGRTILRRLAEALPIKGLGWYRSTHPAIHPRVPEAQKQLLLLVQLTLEERERLGKIIETWRRSVSLWQRNHQGGLLDVPDALNRSRANLELLGELTRAFVGTLSARAAKASRDNVEDYSDRWGRLRP